MKRKIELLLAFLLLSISCAFAQKLTVKGTVLDETGQSIIGATVREKGVETNGASTDLDGHFTLTVNQGATIIVSYVGYKTQEVKAAPQLTIKMAPDNELLDEVIVVAFGTAKKSAFTGSAVQVESGDLEKRQVTNITQALTGKVPGVRITSGDNQPGMTASMQIRGIGSFSASNSPLYVVDGVPYDGDVSAINPQDIASVSILKDAASAALYGARGANGVVMLTTKSGSRSQDRMHISFEARYGVNSRAVGDYDVISDPKVYAAKYFESLYNYNIIKEGATDQSAYAAAVDTYFSDNPKTGNLKYHPFTFPNAQRPFVIQPDGTFVMDPGATIGSYYTGADGKKYWLQPDDWQDIVFSNNPRQEYNISLSGSSKNANYFMSAGYLNDKGYTVASGFERFTARLKGDYNPMTWLKMGGNIGLTNYTSNTLGNTDESGHSGNIFAVTNFIAPIYPMYVRGEDKQIVEDDWGHQIYDYGNGTYPGLTRPFLSLANPLGNNMLDKHDHKCDMVSARGYVDFLPLEGLKLTFNVGFDTDNTYSTDVRNPFFGQFADGGGSVDKDFYRSHALNLQQLANYVKSFGKHNLALLAGHEYYMRRSYTFYGGKQNMYLPDNVEIDGAIKSPKVGSYRSEYGTEGYLARVQYDYDNKYFASASYRRDASSRFAKGHRWGNFWSVGGSWILSKEAWMESTQSWLDMLKLKVSYGVQGNDAIGSFGYTDRYVLKNANDKPSIEFDRKGNENITWETSYNLNAGVEFSLFGERLSGGLDVYSREVTDMLFWRSVARSGGYGGYYDNIGTMRNVGVDFNLNGVVLKTDKVDWSLFVNGGHFRNEIMKLPPEWEAVEDGYRDGSRVYKVGGSLYDRAYAHYLGVNDQGQSTWEIIDPKTNEKTSTTDPTKAMEKENRHVYTDLAPVLTGGFGTSVNAYGFDLSVTLTYQLGGRVIDGVYQDLMHGGTAADAGHNWHKDILNSWTPKRTSSDIPMVQYGGKYFNSTSDRFLTSRDYLALDNITLGYSLPSKWLESLNMSSARIYFVADNVALLSARQGFDPRFGGGVGYKAVRSVSGGLRVTF